MCGVALEVIQFGLARFEPAPRAELRISSESEALVWWGELARSPKEGATLTFELRRWRYRAELGAPDRPSARIELSVDEADAAQLPFEIALPR